MIDKNVTSKRKADMALNIPAEQAEMTKGLPETERRILEAAEQEFMTKGFAGARTTSIAESAGVTHAMFHYYFRTKEKLFDRIISEKVDIIRRLIVTTVADGDLELFDLIEAIISKHLDFLEANPLLPRFLINEFYQNEERRSNILSRIKEFAPIMIGGLQEKIDIAEARGKCRRVDARILLLDIISLNLFSYMASPIINEILTKDKIGTPAFTALRKKENFETIKRKLMPI